MITIDGTEYQIPYKIVKRKADLLFRYAERTEDGVLRSECIGTFYNFSLEMGMSENNAADYEALWLRVTEPTGEHTITILDGTYFTFACYFGNIKDEIYRSKDGTHHYRSLTFDVIATSPARTPA